MRAYLYKKPFAFCKFKTMRYIKMKKIIAVILAVVFASLALLMTGCGKKTDKLIVATSPDFPPFEDVGTGEGSVDGVVGIDVDILKIVAEKLGKELVIESMEFDAVLAGISAAKYDLGAAGISKDPDRAKNMLFTDPYCMASQVIVVKEGSEITGKASLDGKKISVQTGTTAENLCNDLGYSVSAYASNNEAQLALTTGKVDAWIIDDLTAGEMVATYNKNNSQKLVILEEAMSNDEAYAFVAAFGSEELVKEINNILAELIKDGTIKGIFAKYDAPYFAPTED